MAEETKEELQARLATLEAENKKLVSEKKKLLKEALAEAAKTAPVSFEVEGDAENESGEYEFTAPTFTWDDNTVIDVRELANSTNSKDKEKFASICAELVHRKSGIVRRKEN